MAYTVPSLKDLAQRARNAFRADLPGSDAWLWPNNIYVAAKVFAGLVWELFGYLRFINRQQFIKSANDYWLQQHGQEYGIGKKQASYAQGSVVLTGTPSTSTVTTTIAAGTTFARSDGTTYTTNSAVDLSFAGQATVTVTCTTTGPVGNAIYGTTLTSTDPNITAATVDTAGIGGGADQETTEQYRARLLNRKQQPPQGGSANDYATLAKEVAGVTRAWPVKNAYGPGTVGLWFTMDGTYPSGIPQASDVATVQAYIDAKAPVTATAIVQAPRAYPIDVVVGNLTPDTYANRSAAALEISAAVARNAGVATDNSPVTLYQSWLWQAVSSVVGEMHHKIIAPGTDVPIPNGYLPVVRSVTFS